MNKQPTTFVSVYIPPDLLGSIMYLSWLAYPQQNEGDDRRRLIAAYRSMAYSARGKHRPNNPNFESVKREHQWPILERAIEKIEKRRCPAVSLANLQIEGLRPMQAYREIMAREETINDISYARKHIWRESVPALALATPVCSWLNKREITFAELLLNDFWVTNAVETATRVAVPLMALFRMDRLLVPAREHLAASIDDGVNRPD